MGKTKTAPKYLVIRGTDVDVLPCATEVAVVDEIASSTAIGHDVSGWKIIRGEVVPFAVEREPRVTLGASPAPTKPAKAKKQPKPAAVPAKAKAPAGVRLKKDGTPAAKPGRKRRIDMAAESANPMSNGASIHALESPAS